MGKRAMLPALISLGVFGLVNLVVWAGDEREEEVTLDQVPTAVKATILKESAGGKLTEIERELKNGKTTYEAEFLLDGREIEIRIAPDGTLLGREVEGKDDDGSDLRMNQVPGPARAALRKLAGGARIVGLEREMENGVLVYEAEWVAGGSRHEAAVMADGTLLETEEVVPVEQAPAAVQAAITKHFGGAKVIVAKQMIVVYEVEAEVNGQERELYVFPTGRVHDEPDDDQDDDDEDDDDD